MRLSNFLFSVPEISKWQQAFTHLSGISLSGNRAEECFSMLFCGKMEVCLASMSCSGFVPMLKIFLRFWICM